MALLHVKAKFQTLIGTVQSDEAEGHPLGWTLFQTLIGTVQRKLRQPMGQELVQEFQTLIGTVQSRGGLGPCEPLCGVSNPHRYGSKTVAQALGASSLGVSNPHRYGSKLGSTTGCGSTGSFKPS